MTGKPHRLLERIMQTPEDDWIAKAVWIATIGAAIAIGKALSSAEAITARVFLGRVILGSATSLIAGMVLLQIPDVHPLALAGLASALGIAGAQAVEMAMKRWGGGHGG